MIALLEVMLGGPGQSLTEHERSVLDGALYATYARVGITGNPAPLLRDETEQKWGSHAAAA